jgi:hypothetical protein
MLRGWHFGSKTTFFYRLARWSTTFGCGQQGWPTLGITTYFFEFFHIVTHFEMAIYAWFGTPIHPRWKSPMLMNKDELWDFAKAPQLCEGFSKVFVDKYCDRLWILLVTHGSLTFVGLNRSNLHNLSHPLTFFLLLLDLHVGQFYWCKGGGILDIFGSRIYG